MTSAQEDGAPAADGERLVLWQRATCSPGPESESEALAWRRRVATRLSVAGAEPLVTVGSSVAVAFNPLELDEVVELALGLLRDAHTDAARQEVACGLALGAVERCAEDGTLAGTALDRAQALANCAGPGELVLDEAAHARTDEVYLFARMLAAGPLAAHVIDGRHPRRAECRRALSALRPVPLPPTARQAFEQLAALAGAPETHAIAVRASASHVALDHLERLRLELLPALVLRLSRSAGGLQPLGGLQIALQRARGALPAGLDDALRAGVARMSQGHAVSREEAVVTLRELLRQARAPGCARPWIVLERPVELDPASLVVLSDALEGAQPDYLLWLLVDERAGLPSALRAIDHQEVGLEPLGEHDRVRVAEAALGLEPGAEIARRVARLGGDTLLGIVEAARTLVGAGDLVLDAESFRWRTRPRNASLPIPIEGLLTERIAGLQPHGHRVLEALCVAPPAAERALIERVAAADGLTAEALAAGLDQLAREGWLDPDGGLGSLEPAIRNAVRNGMPPARAAELHRFVADALQAHSAGAPAPGFARGLLAHHLAQGGRERAAAEALLDAAQAASEGGFARVAVRLAAFARKLDGSNETRHKARRVAGTLDTHPSAASTLPPQAEPEGPDTAEHRIPSAPPQPDPRQLASAAMRSAVGAIARGELDAAEGLIDTAVAAGWGRHAAQRLWAIVHLAKGHVPEAVRALKQAQMAGGGAATRSREALAAALILLESGAPLDALRSALEALAATRRAHDGGGERVALRLLSDCYRALGHDTQAERIAGAAGTLST